MSYSVLSNLTKVKEKIQQINPANPSEIIAVTKTFNYQHFEPLLKAGHIHYGENKIQEAEKKWTPLFSKHKNFKLHMIGKLQSNKAKKAVKLFDYIHSLDNIKLAKILDNAEKELNKQCKYFIQINIDFENQKSGIHPDILLDFYQQIKKETNLTIIGLMCIPSTSSNSSKAFKTMKDLVSRIDLNHLSMGMSSDYIEAIKFDATFIRLGTVLFGDRIIT